MDPSTERRLRDADPLARATSDPTRDQEWLSETAASVAGLHTSQQTSQETSQETSRPRRPRAAVLVAAAAAVALAAAAGGFLLRGGDDGDGRAATVAAPTVTELGLGAGNTMTSCIEFSVEELSRMQVAFGGTVVDKTEREILVDVETWYRGGDSDQVRLVAPDTQMALLGYSIDFQVGERYLITAYDGTVSFCGFSSPWTPEMGDAFAEAFGG